MQNQTITYLIGKDFVGKSDVFLLKFCDFLSSRQRKLPPLKIFPDEKLYLPNTISHVEIKAEELLEMTFQLLIAMVNDS